MKKLRVFWKLYSMSSMVAKKGAHASRKKYQVTPRSTDFQPETSLKDATKEIQDEHGRRPEGNIYVAHKFAEIVSSTICEVKE